LAQQDGARVHGQAIQFLLDGVVDDDSLINSTSLSMVDTPLKAVAITVSTDTESVVQDRGDSAEIQVPPPHQEAEQCRRRIKRQSRIKIKSKNSME